MKETEGEGENKGNIGPKLFLFFKKIQLVKNAQLTPFLGVPFLAQNFCVYIRVTKSKSSLKL